MKKLFWGLLLLASLTGTGNVCALEEITLQLKWKHQFQFAGYYAALEKGYYADEGLDVTIRDRTQVKDHIQTVLDGNAEYGISDSSLILYRLKGKPVVVLATIFQHSPLVLMTRSEENLFGPLELKNKRVMWQIGLDGAAITAMFFQAGVDLDDIEHVPHNFDDDALAKNDVDAMSAYLTNQPFYYQDLDIDTHIINPINYGVDFYGDTLFTSENEIKHHPERAKRFLRASLKGWKYALENKAEVIDWLQKKYGNQSPFETLMNEANATEKMILPNTIDIGDYSISRFQRIADIYRSLDMAAETATFEGIDSAIYFDPQKRLPPWVWWMSVLFIVTFIAFAVLYFINHKLKALVIDRTVEIEQARAELAEHNEKLEQTVLERTKALQDSMERAQQERDKAEEANLVKSRFLSNMSHELRTPMHAIMSFSKLGLKHAENQKIQRYLDNIYASGNRLTNLLNDLLDLSKLESGKMLPEFAWHDLVEITRAVVEQMSSLSQQKHIIITLQSDPSFPVFMDNKLITQVIVNLLSNAIKFSQEGSQIVIDIALDNNSRHKKVHFSITDQGVGIPENELKSVFDSFVQSSKTRSDSGGTGLGLPISKEIINLHRGHIWAESPVPGKTLGTRFSFIIPVSHGTSEELKTQAIERLDWTQDYSVGIPFLDQQHKHIFSVINQLLRLDNRDVHNENLHLLLKEANDYIDYHLRQEEKLLRSSQYPGLDQHLNHHESFEEQLGNFNLKMTEEKLDSLQELKQFLLDWWHHHILEEDKQYAEHLYRYLYGGD